MRLIQTEFKINFIKVYHAFFFFLTYRILNELDEDELSYINIAIARGANSSSVQERIDTNFVIGECAYRREGDTGWSYGGCQVQNYEITRLKLEQVHGLS